MNGIVKFFEQKKGFGFIIVDDTKDELFFHITECVDQVAKDDKVTFEITSGKKGMCAVNVKLVQ
jgi:CspA family cold shock protein